MGSLDLRTLIGDEIVIHFGGSLTSVDAYTFANSLVAFADTVRDINSIVDPNQSIQIRVEAISKGSFRAKITKTQKGVRGFFSDGIRSVFWGLVAALIYDNLSDNEPTITINDDSVIYQYGEDRVILPRESHEHFDNVRKVESPAKHIQKTFKSIEKDDAIENFGLTKSLEDEVPIFSVNKQEITRLATGQVLPVRQEVPRTRQEIDTLVIIKAWFKPGSNKWTFEWNGVPIAAPIIDQSFYDKLLSHEISIGVGDAIKAKIQFKQYHDNELDLWVTDQNSYEVIEIIEFYQRQKS